MTALAQGSRIGELAAWFRSLLLGAVLGLAVVVAREFGWLAVLERGVSDAGSLLDRLVGPVWIPMFAIGLRVGWLALRALCTRMGKGPSFRPVRPELSQLAPLFAALGLLGTVWGLARAYDALGSGEFLAELPALLVGLGAAMTSTLVGLALQISTLLLAAFNPAWTRVGVQESPEGVLGFSLDEHPIGDLDCLVAVIEARQPEALCVRYDAAVSPGARAQLRSELWRRIDAATPLRQA